MLAGRRFTNWHRRREAARSPTRRNGAVPSPSASGTHAALTANVCASELIGSWCHPRIEILELRALNASLTWGSPLEAQRFAERYDAAFVLAIQRRS
jgi:hypothetical protein